MQLNLYVPADKQHLLNVLETVSKTTGRPKNEIVLAALEQHLTTLTPSVGQFHLGKVKSWVRSDLYEERLER
ncbi:MAG: hypothetical protein IMX01_04940 [Limnochordaceae bacterium]|nr:hypothetical protein [Limnochordaceae bacterium]